MIFFYTLLKVVTEFFLLLFCQVDFQLMNYLKNLQKSSFPKIHRKSTMNKCFNILNQCFFNFFLLKNERKDADKYLIEKLSFFIKRSINFITILFFHSWVNHQNFVNITDNFFEFLCFCAS